MSQLCLYPCDRYFHVTRGDEELFRATGEIVPQVLDQAVHKALYMDAVITGNRPACKVSVSYLEVVIISEGYSKP